MKTSHLVKSVHVRPRVSCFSSSPQTPSFPFSSSFYQGQFLCSTLPCLLIGYMLFRCSRWSAFVLYRVLTLIIYNPVRCLRLSANDNFPRSRPLSSAGSACPYFSPSTPQGLKASTLILSRRAVQPRRFEDSHISTPFRRRLSHQQIGKHLVT